MLEVNPQMILDAIADRRVVIQAEYDRKLAENEAAEAAYEATPWYKRMFCDRRDYSANLFILDPCWLDKHYRSLRYLCQYAIAIGQATIELPLEYSHLLPIPAERPEKLLTDD